MEANREIVAATPLPSVARSYPFRSYLLAILTVTGIAMLTCLGPTHSISTAYHNVWMQAAHNISLGMIQYADDHEGRYPDGRSSTEAFQLLLDGKYINDPSIFYIPLPGKTKALPGQPLKPENICYDVTAGADVTASPGLPAVFMTGYRVTYAPDAAAVPLRKPYPPFGQRGWAGWWRGEPPGATVSPGVAVNYRDGTSFFRRLVTEGDGAGSIPHFIPPDFDAHGKTYRQLTPEGPLP